MTGLNSEINKTIMNLFFIYLIDATKVIKGELDKFTSKLQPLINLTNQFFSKFDKSCPKELEL